MIKSILLSCTLIFCLMLLFFQQAVSNSAVLNAISLCVSSVIPALFPCFIITKFWISTGAIQKLSKKLCHSFEKVFHISSTATYAFLIGCISGFPLGAQEIFRLYENNKLSKSHAEQALLFCSNASPAFVIGFVGNYLFQNTYIGFILWSIHITVSILLGILFRPNLINTATEPETVTEREKNYLSLFTKAILDSGRATLQICTMVIFFSMLTSHIRELCPATWENNPFFIICLGLLELTSGIDSLYLFPKYISFILASVLISWNGMCIHFQIISSMRKHISLRKYFLGKLFHMLISSSVSILIYQYLPLETTCANTVSQFTYSTYFAILTLALFLILKTSSGKKTVNHI